MQKMRFDQIKSNSSSVYIELIVCGDLYHFEVHRRLVNTVLMTN